LIPFKTLSIDGSGIRGAAVLILKIARRSGKSIFELFNLIAGIPAGAYILPLVC
jgi:patatin-like phospholipase/acyl hydrolase